MHIIINQTKYMFGIAVEFTFQKYFFYLKYIKIIFLNFFKLDYSCMKSGFLEIRLFFYIWQCHKK
jgi:hypothetical protein